MLMTPSASGASARCFCLATWWTLVPGRRDLTTPGRHGPHTGREAPAPRAPYGWGGACLRRALHNGYVSRCSDVIHDRPSGRVVKARRRGPDGSSAIGVRAPGQPRPGRHRVLLLCGPAYSIQMEERQLGARLGEVGGAWAWYMPPPILGLWWACHPTSRPSQRRPGLADRVLWGRGFLCEVGPPDTGSGSTTAAAKAGERRLGGWVAIGERQAALSVNRS
jgi:hypothetical protein